MEEAQQHEARTIVQSADGSSTLYIPALNEHYHSVHGARNESMHVFINAGLKHLSEGLDKIRIFEMGFGTGLNALLTIICAGSTPIEYFSVEKYPLDEKEWTLLDFGANETNAQYLNTLHRAPWDETTVINPNFTLTKFHASLHTLSELSNINLVYFDAFSPDIQPDLWTLEVFEKIYGMMANGGILVTYSAKGQVRRNMQGAGFVTERIPGPAGKREMLRAVKRD